MQDAKIREAIENDFNSIFYCEQMKNFEKGLEYKSQKTAAVDKALMNYLINKIDQYKNGWIMANAKEHVNLYKQHAANKEVFYTLRVLNDHLNNFIKSVKGNIPDDILNDLRALERKLQDNERL